jgi:hypothetical protein
VLANVTATTVDLTQPDGSSEAPIKIDDLVNDLWLENITRSSSAQITDSAITNNRLTFSAVPANSANGDLCVVRRNAALAGLNYLEHPANKTTYGPRTAKLDKTDIVGIDNILPNGLANQFSGPGPDNWNAIGGAVLSQETSRPWWQHGGASIKVVVATDGGGIESDAVNLNATVTNPHYVGQVWLVAETLDSGAKVKAQIVDVDTGEAFPPLGNEASVLITTEAPTMVPILTGINWQKRGTSQVKIRVTVEGGAATFRLDGAQIFRGVNPAQNIHEGYASNRLWSLAQDLLIGQRGTPVDNFEVDAVDLWRVDQTTYPASALEVGGTVALKDEDLGVDVQTRIVKRTRNLLVAGATRIELSDKRRDLIGMIGKRGVRAVIDAAPPMSGDPMSSGRGLAVMAAQQISSAAVPAGAWFAPGWATTDMVTGSARVTEGDLYMIPFTPSLNMTIDRMNFDQTNLGGSGKARIGVYRDTGTFYPGNLILQSSDLVITGVDNGQLTVTGLSIDLTAGQTYWAAFQCTLDDSGGTDSPSARLVNVAALMIPSLGGTENMTGSFIWMRATGQGGSMPNPFPDTGERGSTTSAALVRLRRSA